MPTDKPKTRVLNRSCKEVKYFNFEIILETSNNLS